MGYLPLLAGPSAASLLGLGNADISENLENLSTEELRHLHAIERDRLVLAGQLGTVTGALGVFGLGRYLGLA